MISRRGGLEEEEEEEEDGWGVVTETMHECLCLSATCPLNWTMRFDGAINWLRDSLEGLVLY